MRTSKPLPSAAGRPSLSCPSTSADAILVESIAVKTGRLECSIRIPDKRCRYVDAELSRAVQRRYPTLSQHACVNDQGPTFGCVLDSTSVPHLLEHVIIDLQTRASADQEAVFIGTSEWVDEPSGSARVQVSFKDDLQALQALKEAVRYLSDALDRRR